MRYAITALWFFVSCLWLSAQSVPTVIAGGGSKATFIGADAAPLTSPIAPMRIAAGPNGDVYLLDEYGFLLKLSASGRLSVIASNLAVTTPSSVFGGIAADRNGNVFFADYWNHIVLRIDSRGAVTTVAGTSGQSGFAGDGGPAVNAKLSSPSDVAIDATGNLYIADFTNSRIRRVAPDGTITTFANISSVSRIAVDPTGGLYCYAGVLYRVDAQGTLTRYSTAGTGPFLAVDNQGRLYTTNAVVPLVGAHAVVRVTPTTVTIVAGSTSAGFAGDGGLATSAQMNLPTGIAFDASNNMVIVDANNHRIRRVDQNNVIRTVAGNGSVNYAGDGGPATAAALSRPGLAFDSGGNLFIADRGNARIRKVDSTGRISTFYEGPGPFVSGSAVAVQPNGSVLFVCSGAICRTSPDGKSGTRIIGGGTATVADNVAPDSVLLAACCTLAADKAGNIFIGALSSTFAGTPSLYRLDSRNVLSVVERFPGLSQIEAIAVNPAGNFIVARFGVISTYSPAGRLISRRTMPPARQILNGNQVLNILVTASGVAEDAKGNIYLSETCGDADACVRSPLQTVVYKFTKDGNLGEYYNFTVVGNPGGLAIEGNRLFIADHRRNTISVAPLYDGPLLSSARVLNGASVQPGPIASEELVRMSGVDLATSTATRTLPAEQIDGTSISVRDSSGSSAPMGLYSVSPGLVVGVVPSGMKAGAGTLVVENSLGKSNGTPVQIAAIAPGLHAINAGGSGPAFATLETTGADGGTISQPAYVCSAPGNCVHALLYPGSQDATSTLSFEATGVRGYAEASMRLGAFDAEIVDVRPDTQPGFDLVRVRVPPAFAESGYLDAEMTVDGVKSNAVTVVFGNPARFELTIRPTGALKDQPALTLKNLSSKAEITRFVFTVGDTTRNFDRFTQFTAANTSAGVSATLVSPSPDTFDGRVRSDKLEVKLSGLLPGKSWAGFLELDAGEAETIEDFTKVFFNNGDAPNSTVLVEFSDGRVVTLTVPDGVTEGDIYVFGESQPGTNGAGYDLSIGPGGSGTDTPRFILTNRSDVADITRFKFTVGDTGKNFDGASLVLSLSSAGVRGATVVPDEGNDGVRSDYFEVTLTGMGPGKAVSIATDLDDDRGNTVEDFVRSFFNNGEAPNSVVEVTFSDGRVLSMTLPDGEAAGNLFTFSQTAAIN